MQIDGGFHLTYCSNIHAGESWEEVRANLETYIPQVRRGLCDDAPFGIGLRLSAVAADALAEPAALTEFQQFLQASNAYVFTINGFPYGVFHRARVKEEVYLPDWKDEERLRYTNVCANIMATLLPDMPGLEGSVSTVPGAFKAEVGGPEDERAMARMMLRHVAELHAIHQRTGKVITLALEPEPCCHLETVEESIAFFREHLLHPELLGELATKLGVEGGAARGIVQRHIGLCYDACHMAVEYEDMAGSLRALAGAGIKICKFQISSAIKLQFLRGDDRAENLLRPFAESTYLHQTVQRSASGVERFTDLPEALASVAEAGNGEELEWRVHFHVPIFLEEMRNFQTTQRHLVELLAAIKETKISPYLEVETYTWDVLPAEYRTEDMASAIRRELNWVRDTMGGETQ